MAKQTTLFPEPKQTLSIPKDSSEPRVWVKRLILWEEPGTILREVALRRGLNIVWSPDPGVSASEPGAEGGSGHGAGKTLFCRLLRYCLGEEGFAATELRHAVLEKYPKALVGAQISIGGRDWGVVRPLGIGRKTVVGEALPEDLTEGVHRTGMAPLIDAIADALQFAEIDENMPTTANWRSWLLALAWLSRDQDSRFGHILDWRHTRSESGSPAAGLSREDGVVAVRLLLKAITRDELQARARQENSAAESQRLERDLAFHERTAEQLFMQLSQRLGVGDVAGPVTIESLAARAKALADAADEPLSNPEESRAESQREQLDQVVRERAVLEKQQDQGAGMIALQQEQLRFLRGERANLDGEEIKARLGPICPVCSVPIDEALANGCGLSHVVLDPSAIAEDKARNLERIAATEAAIRVYETQRGERQLLLVGIKTREEQLREELRKAAEQRRTVERQQRDEWLKASQASVDVARLARAYQEIERLQARMLSLADEKDGIDKELDAFRNTHANTVGRLAHLFAYVCSALLGPAADARLSLTGQGLRADVRVGGTAMESLKAIAFDVAAMLMTMEGRTHLPALVIHDSPREADLGISHYHRLFRFVHDLEQVGPAAPFQYIITTTTEPPEDLATQPPLVLRLRGTEASDRLLRTEL